MNKQNRLSYIVIQSLAGPASLPVLPTSWSQYALCPRRLTGTNSLNQQPCPPLPAEFSQKASQQEKEGTEDREIRCPFSSPMGTALRLQLPAGSFCLHSLPLHA